MNAFGAHPLNSILPVAIDRCIAEREVAPATVNRELAFLKRVFALGEIDLFDRLFGLFN